MRILDIYIPQYTRLCWRRGAALI